MHGWLRCAARCTPRRRQPGEQHSQTHQSNQHVAAEVVHGRSIPRTAGAPRYAEGMIDDPRFQPDGRTQKQRMLAGDQYLAEDPELIRDATRAALLTARFNVAAADDHAGRAAVLLELLGSIGEGTIIRPPFRCDYGFQTHIGSRTFANFGLIALDVGRIMIGDDVQIGPNVQLLTPTHPTEPEPRRAKWDGSKPITIGNNVWLGGGVIVCPGVTIGEHTVVGAGAVVVRDLPPRVVAVGNPARIVRRL